MKQKILISLTLLFLSFQYGYSQNPFKTIDISKVNENTIIKDAHGKIKAISMSELRKLMSTGKWVLEPENDSITGKLKSVYLTDKGDFEKFKAMYDEARKKFIAFVNTKAPVFKTKDINRNIISSEKAKGKVMVLNFWFIH
jgi:hypothetical protein